MMPHVLKSGYYAPYDLAEVDMPDNIPAIHDDSKGHAFWQYVYLQKKNGAFVSNEQSMLDFVDEKRIEYLIVNHGEALPRVFEDRVVLIASYDGNVMYRIND